MCIRDRALGSVLGFIIYYILYISLCARHTIYSILGCRLCARHTIYSILGCRMCASCLCTVFVNICAVCCNTVFVLFVYCLCTVCVLFVYCLCTVCVNICAVCCSTACARHCFQTSGLPSVRQTHHLQHSGLQSNYLQPSQIRQGNGS